MQSVFQTARAEKARKRKPRVPSPSRIRAIRLTGIVKPVVVQSGLGNGRYRLLRGRMQWQAAIAAKLPRIPAIECKHPGLTAALHRLDELVAQSARNPVHTARALKSVQDCIAGCTRSDLAGICGWPLNTVVHHLQLLDMPPAICRLFELERLSFGHGKVLSGKKLRRDPPRQAALTIEAVKQKWSVRELEAAIKGSSPPAPPASVKAALADTARIVNDPNIQRLADALTGATGLPTTIEHREDGQGRVVFAYYSLDEMDNLLRFFPSAES